MKIVNLKFLAAFLPALAIGAAYKFAFGNWFFGWLYGELRSYEITEWLVILIPQIACLFVRRKEKYILAILFCLAATFTVDVFRFSSDSSKDIDMIFYFGAFVRMITIASLICPLTIAVSELFIENRRKFAKNQRKHQN